jgi:predicted Zn-dependent protease
VSGLPATHFVGVRRNEKGQSQGVEATVVTGPANRNYVLGYASKDEAALQRARRQLQEAQASFRALTATDRAAARPWVIKTVPYPRGGFAALARQSPLSNDAEQHLRLLNGVYAGGEPQAGQPVKVVE